MSPLKMKSPRGVFAARIDLSSSLFRSVGIEVRDGDTCTFTEKGVGDFPADAACSPGDECNLLVETHKMTSNSMTLPLPMLHQIVVDDLAEAKRQVGDDVTGGAACCRNKSDCQSEHSPHRR